MKKIYFMVITIFSVSLFLFVISFVYLDKHNHRAFYYNISIDGQYVGASKVDKFVTEEKLVFKSVATTPFCELFTENRTKLELDRRYNLENYQKDLLANGGSYLFYAENKDDSLSLLSRFMSRFTYLTKMHIRRGSFIFEEDSPITYLPIIENYDFKRGGAQGFNSIIYLPDSHMPPIKRFVTLTSIKDEYLKISRRKIKVENLLLKIKGLPAGNVWVAKSDRSLIMIEIPSIGLRVTRGFEFKETLPKTRPVTQDDYISKDILFRSKGRQMSGTLTMPAGDAKCPAVLLIWGPGPQDRNDQGLFRSIAEYLPKYGYCVMRFDKRGIGSSAGDSALTTADSEFNDLSAALGFLRSQNNVNVNRITVISHSEGVFNALRLAVENPDIKGLVLLAPFIDLRTQGREDFLRARAAKENWDDDYLNTAIRALQETKEKVDSTKRDWAYILSKRVYLKDVRNDDAIRPEEVLDKVSTPIAILQGKKDLKIPSEYAARLDKELSAHEKTKHSVIYFDNLGHFFGRLTNDAGFKISYVVDKEVLAAIRDWLNLNTVEPAKPEDGTAGAAVI